MIDLIKKILYIFLTILIILSGQYIAERIGYIHYEIDKKTDLYDMTHKILPDLHKYHVIINIIPIILIIYLFIDNNGSNVFRDVLFILPVVFIIRALTIMSTILPKHELCVAENNIISNFINGGGCYDKVFSGHTSFVAIFTLSMYDNKLIDILSFSIINIINCLLLLITRAHYTVDIILGLVISYLVYRVEKTM